MATIGRIDIAMGVDTAKFATDLETAAGKLTGFGSKIERNMASAQNPLESLSGSVGALGKGLAALGVAAGVGLGLKAMVGAAIETERTILGLSKATDLEGEQLSALKGELQQLSMTLKGVPLDDLYGIATAGAKLGVAQGDLVKYTEAIAMLSTAMDDVPAEQISEQMGKIGTVFKLSVPDVVGMGSAIDKLADSGVSSADGIMNVVQRISGAAAASKLAAPAAVALAAALLDTGTQAELGATSIQRLLMGLNNVEGRAGFAKTLGISAEEFGRQVEASPIKAIQAWLESLKAMDAMAQQSAIKAIGVDSVQAAGEIMKLAQQTDVLGKYLALANEQMVSHEQINKSYALTAGTTGSAITQAGNGFKILADDIGSSIMPVLRGLADAFVYCLPTIRSAIGGIIAIVEGGMRLVQVSVNGLFIGIAGAFSGVVKIIGSLGGLMPNMLKSITDPLDAFTDELKAKNKEQGAALLKLGKDTVIGRTLFYPGQGDGQGPQGVGDGAAAKHAAEVAKAGAKTSAVADDVAKLNTKLEEQVATFGMTSAAAEVYKLKMAGASAADLAKAEALGKQLEALEASKKAQDEQARESKRVADEIGSITRKLEEQAATFGMSAAQLDAYRLKQLGASDAVIQHAQALADQRDELEKNKKAQDDLAARAKDVYEATRTPIEKATAEAAKLKEMFGKGLIDKDTFNRAGSKLAEDAMKGAGGGNDYHENGALELGSKEARSSILKFRGMGGDGDGLRDIAKLNREQLAQQTQNNGMFRRLLAVAEREGPPPIL